MNVFFNKKRKLYEINFIMRNYLVFTRALRQQIEGNKNIIYIYIYLSISSHHLSNFSPSSLHIIFVSASSYQFYQSVLIVNLFASNHHTNFSSSPLQTASLSHHLTNSNPSPFVDFSFLTNSPIPLISEVGCSSGKMKLFLYLLSINLHREAVAA